MSCLSGRELPPGTSSLNFLTGRTLANNGVVALSETVRHLARGRSSPARAGESRH